jgi:hypothetical protein
MPGHENTDNSQSPVPGFEYCWGEGGAHAPTCTTCPFRIPAQFSRGPKDKCARKPEWLELEDSAHHFCGEHPFHAANAAKIANIAVQRSMEADQRRASLLKPANGLVIPS